MVGQTEEMRPSWNGMSGSTARRSDALVRTFGYALRGAPSHTQLHLALLLHQRVHHPHHLHVPKY